MKKTVFITGGAGFIGGALVRHLAEATEHRIVNIDKLTYASALPDVGSRENYFFEKADIADASEMRRLFETYAPDLVMHLAAESHVDRSIGGPEPFIQSNIIGTFALLEEARRYWENLSGDKKGVFRFHHVSTDEVYGDLAPDAPAFSENTPYAPSSPYSASKAASDHLVRAWNRTYGLPVVLTNCSNNYGPGQYPEKLIPLMITNAVQGLPLPVYGSGTQIRDWLYVEDHVHALWLVAEKGQIGETYNIGGLNEVQNIEVVTKLCDLMEEMKPEKPSGISHYRDLITHVADRPGHDIRYAINCDKIKRELGWTPKESFDTGLTKTVSWYLAQFVGSEREAA